MARRTAPTIIALCLLVTAACRSDADETGDTQADEIAVVPSVTVPAERLTPFCQAMIDLADRLADEPGDARQLIIDAYVAILDEVPEVIADDFRAVLDGLRGEGSPTSTSAPATSPTSPAAPGTGTTVADGSLTAFDAEGRVSDESPVERVNDYVQFTCRDSQNNPGPPATQPLQEIPETTAG